MDSQQAKQILAIYRPGVDDADPQVAEALVQAKRDPQLARWLEGQVALDAAVRTNLRNLPAPLGLKTRILANAKAKPRSNLWAWLAPAVAIALAVAFVLLWPRSGNSFAAYRGEMAKFVSAKYDLDLHSENLDELRQNFAKRGYPSDYVVPPGLNNIAVEGGCLRQWQGHKVSLVCMEAKDHDVWMFVIESKDLPAAPSVEPTFGKDGEITTASWTLGHLTYILATERDESELKSYLPQ